jgi:hypothetical protein
VRLRAVAATGLAAGAWGLLLYVTSEVAATVPVLVGLAAARSYRRVRLRRGIRVGARRSARERNDVRGTLCVGSCYGLLMPRGGRTHRINVLLGDEHAQRLKRMAEQSHAAEGTLARSLLSRAIDDAEIDGRTMVEVLDGVPGARQRIALAREQIARGEGIPLEDL